MWSRRFRRVTARLRNVCLSLARFIVGTGKYSNSPNVDKEIGYRSIKDTADRDRSRRKSSRYDIEVRHRRIFDVGSERTRVRAFSYR
jgi:hypothetical protein